MPDIWGKKKKKLVTPSMNWLVRDYVVRRDNGLCQPDSTTQATIVDNSDLLEFILSLQIPTLLDYNAVK